MSTLKELVEKHGFGKKFVYTVQQYIYDFTPLAKHPNMDIFLGYTDKYSCESYGSDTINWELYEEPKKKIKYYEWLVEPKDSKPYIYAGLYTEEEAKKNWSEGRNKLTKLREFEVDV